jgi:hypothetical protein
MSTPSGDRRHVRPTRGRTAQQRFGDQVRVDHVGVALDALLELFQVHLTFTSIAPCLNPSGQ